MLVTELLRANLYEFQKYNRESGDAPYFTLPRMQSIARQVGEWGRRWGVGWGGVWGEGASMGRGLREGMSVGNA